MFYTQRFFREPLAGEKRQKPGIRYHRRAAKRTLPGQDRYIFQEWQIFSAIRVEPWGMTHLIPFGMQVFFYCLISQNL